MVLEVESHSKPDNGTETETARAPPHGPPRIGVQVIPHNAIHRHHDGVVTKTAIDEHSDEVTGTDGLTTDAYDRLGNDDGDSVPVDTGDDTLDVSSDGSRGPSECFQIVSFVTELQPELPVVEPTAAVTVNTRAYDSRTVTRPPVADTEIDVASV